MKVVESRVIVKVDKEALKQKIGNFEISEGVNDYEKAEVVAVGPKVENITPGEHVYIYKGAGKAFKIDDVEYRTITLNEIIVIL